MHRLGMLRWLSSEAILLEKLRVSAEEKCQEAQKQHPDLSFPSRPPSRRQSATSQPDPIREPEETVSVLLTVHRAQILDLTSAFSEGFLGYSIDAQITENTQESTAADICGQAAEWETCFQL